MVLVRRYPVSLAAVVLAALATIVFFAVARPRYQPAIEIENVDLARQTHYSVADVKAAFAVEGIELADAQQGSVDGITMLGAGAWPWGDKDLVITVLPEKGTLGIGHGDWENEGFEQRVGNVIVQYGGRDTDVMQRVERAIATLQPRVAPRVGAPLNG